MLISGNSPHGGDVYSRQVALDFSANTNPFGMPEPVKAALRRAAACSEIYPDPYCTALREGISRLEGVPPSQILCGNGAAELIYQFCYALPGQASACVISPAFSEYETALTAAGASVSRHFLREADGFRLTERVLELPRPGLDAIFLCSPNNPTGITVPPALLRQLAQACARQGTRLFLDLCFLDLSDDPGLYSAAQLTAEFPAVFILKAFTKSYAMAGVRLGYGLCADTDFLSRMAEKAQCWNVSTPAQMAGLAALSCGAYVRESQLSLTQLRKTLRQALERLGLRVWDGEANYLLLQGPNTLHRQLLEEGILIRSCANYPGLDDTFFRIAVKTQEENQRLLAALGGILSCQKQNQL